MSPDRLAGDKTWSLGEERDIWEQDGERDGGHVPTRSPSPVSVETFTARRWVPFTACVPALSSAAPVDQVSHKVYVAVLAGEGCMNSAPLFFIASLVYFLQDL